MIGLVFKVTNKTLAGSGSVFVAQVKIHSKEDKSKRKGTKNTQQNEKWIGRAALTSTPDHESSPSRVQPPTDNKRQSVLMFRS